MFACPFFIIYPFTTTIRFAKMKLIFFANFDVIQIRIISVILNMTSPYFICDSQGIGASTAPFADYPSLL